MAETNDPRVEAGTGSGSGMNGARETERRAIDMWAPIVPVPEVMSHVAENFPDAMLGYLRVFWKQRPTPQRPRNRAVVTKPCRCPHGMFGTMPATTRRPCRSVASAVKRPVT